MKSKLSNKKHPFYQSISFVFSLIGILVLLSNCNLSSKSQNIEFDKFHRDLVRYYQVGDTICFANKNNNRDSFIVVQIDSINNNGDFMNIPHSSLTILIHHLNKKSTQDLIQIGQDKTEKKYTVYINYLNFSSNPINSFPKKTSGKLLTKLNIADYWILNTDLFLQKDSLYINKIVWTSEYGLTGYSLNNEELFLLEQTN